MKTVFSISQIYKMTFKALWKSQSCLYHTVCILGIILNISLVAYLWSTSIWLALAAGWAFNNLVSFTANKLVNWSAYQKALTDDLSIKTFDDLCSVVADDSGKEGKIGFKI